MIANTCRGLHQTLLIHKDVVSQATLVERTDRISFNATMTQAPYLSQSQTRAHARLQQPTTLSGAGMSSSVSFSGTCQAMLCKMVPVSSFEAVWHMQRFWQAECGIGMYEQRCCIAVSVLRFFASISGTPRDWLLRECVLAAALSNTLISRESLLPT